MPRRKTPESAVSIKGGTQGAVVMLDDQYRMLTVFNMLEKRVRQNKDFLSQGTLTINLKNRHFTTLEFDYLSSVLKYKYGVTICTDNPPLCSEEEETPLIESKHYTVDQPIKQTNELKADGCKVIKHTLRAGQYTESDGTIIIIGDVNPGAEVKAGDNVIVYGIIKGRVEAGTNDETNAYIVALDFEPVQLKIGSKIATSPAGHLERELKPQKAYVHEGSIVVEFLR